MTDRGAVLLTKSEVAALARPVDYYDAVAAGFRAFAEGKVHTPSPMEIHGADGAFHIKGAAMEIVGRRYAAVKVNGNFPLNPLRTGLPTIQGAILLSDAENGTLLAIMDSIEITLRRTAAASAVATDLLSRKAAETLLICGCGVQGRAHLEAIAPLRPFKRFFAFDAAPERAQKFSAEAMEALRLPVEPVADIAGAAEASDVIVTATTARSPLSLPASLRPGAFVAAVGADNPMKNEIAPSLMASSVVIADVTAQCEIMGDLRVAIAAGAMTRDDVRAEIGEVLTGERPGRLTDDEVVIFDSTGAAFQDLTAAVMIFGRAKSSGMGAWIDLQR